MGNINKTPDYDPCRGDPLPRIESAAVAPLLAALMGRPHCEDPSRELDRLGVIIELSEKISSTDGLRNGIEGAERLLELGGTPAEVTALAHYFLSNAWDALRLITHTGCDLRAWEQAELDREIIHLRQAVRLGAEIRLPTERLCQMYTNLGNLMNHCGRVVEALAAWDTALEMNSSFAMALGNRGVGLKHYAHLVHDPGHQIFHLQEAHRNLRQAIELGRGIEDPKAINSFAESCDSLEMDVPSDALNLRLPKGRSEDTRSKTEHAYRKWCLRNRLFLNDLNDVGRWWIAAADVMTLPSLTTPTGSVQPSIIGFFNQIKQEFISARYHLYAGTKAKRTHFSDRDVTLINTLDYPSYGLGVERVKVAFRVSYSIFDKIAYLLNEYFALGIAERQVSFRKIWYQNLRPKDGLRPNLYDPNNYGLKGLFWLAKDLYEPVQEFAEAIEPDAQRLSEIRNHLEHKYFKVHEFMLSHMATGAIGFEPLAYSIGRTEFENKTLRLMQLVRSALIYLIQAIYGEEYRRKRDQGEGPTLPIILDTWEDEWKR